MRGGVHITVVLSGWRRMRSWLRRRSRWQGIKIDGWTGHERVPMPQLRLRIACTRRRDVLFHRPAPLELFGDDPAEAGPGQACGPTGQDVGGIVHAHEDSAHADQPGEHHCDADEIKFYAQLLDEAG